MKKFIALFCIVEFMNIKSHQVFAGTSSSNRSGKVGSVSAEVIGWTLTPVHGIRGSYFLSPQMQVELGYATGEAGDSGGSSWNYKKSIYSSKVKYFFGDSFYIDGGLGIETWDLDYSVKTSTDSSSSIKKLSGSVTNTGIEFHIGNQWQWSNFTLGCDWFGYFLSISTSKNFSNDSSVDPTDKKDEEDTLSALMSGSSPHITRFYVGWSF